MELSCRITHFIRPPAPTAAKTHLISTGAVCTSPITAGFFLAASPPSCAPSTTQQHSLRVHYFLSETPPRVFLYTTAADTHASQSSTMLSCPPINTLYNMFSRSARLNHRHTTSTFQSIPTPHDLSLCAERVVSGEQFPRAHYIGESNCAPAARTMPLQSTVLQIHGNSDSTDSTAIRQPPESPPQIPAILFRDPGDADELVACDRLWIFCSNATVSKSRYIGSRIGPRRKIRYTEFVREYFRLQGDSTGRH